MLDNKGFAVTSVLYTLLIAFLLFLGVSLSMLSTSNSLISNMNRDLTDNLYVNAYLNIDNENDLSNSLQIVKIRYNKGTIYWPQDFSYKKDRTVLIYNNCNSDGIKILIDDQVDNEVCGEKKINPSSIKTMKILDTKQNKSTELDFSILKEEN